MKKKVQTVAVDSAREKYARVVRDSRDGNKDVFIPRATARRLYNEGKLAIDATNSAGMQYTVYAPIEDDGTYWFHPEMLFSGAKVKP